MPPEPKLWLWCLRGVLKSMTFDLAERWFNDERELFVGLFNFAWQAYGGTAGDAIYEAYIATFGLEREEIDDGLGGFIDVYSMKSEWWQPVTDEFKLTMPADQVCKMPDWD